MNIYEAIHKLNPSVVTVRDGTAFDATGVEVVYDKQAAINLVNATKYVEQRESEYPSFAEQFDLLYHGGFDAWKASIDAIKTKYPKP